MDSVVYIIPNKVTQSRKTKAKVTHFLSFVDMRFASSVMCLPFQTIIETSFWQALVMYTFNPSTWEEEAGGSLEL